MDKELIKQEIERLSDEYPMSRGLLKHLDKFIDSLPEKSASEDLEEEIESFWNSHDGSMNKFEYQRIVDCAHHFAEWQKQQMMKDAVESTIKYKIGSAEIPQCDRRYQVLSDPTPITNAKLGDKVKIIIIKEEK